MADRFHPERLRRVRASVEALLQETEAAAEARSGAILAVPPERRESARNLAHYLAVRAHDLRPLQHELADLSLSSLGRMEGSVQHTLRGVQWALLALGGHHTGDCSAHEHLEPGRAAHLLAEHTVQLLGPAHTGRHTRILVTLPASASHDRALLRDLLLAGMDLVRINLAHDDQDTWTAMAGNVRAAAAEAGRPCRILADLPGPKLRTGPLEPGPRVVKVRPERDPLGNVTRPARVAFEDPQGPGGATAAGVDCRVPLTVPLAPFAEPGDELVLRDTRGRRRAFLVERTADDHLVAAIDRSTYLATDAEVALERRGERIASAHVGQLPEVQSFLPLAPGDRLVVTRTMAPGRAAAVLLDGTTTPARISCTLPEVFTAVLPGHRILFDDGKINGVVETNDGAELQVRIRDTAPGGARLRAEKGINLPDSDLHTSALTDDDLGNLDWVAAHADLVGLSFVQRPGDVMRLHAELYRRNRPDLGIVLKIETQKAFQRLPDLLFAGLQSPPLGVMVARGDLAVEVGYGRLAEVQEEILWLCEAAHLPVIWATQVLDSMARTGMPSRAEVTDAAMGVRAECVMLNKGPHIVATTRFLGNVLERMQDHHTKKRSMLRRLRIAGDPHRSNPAN